MKLAIKLRTRLFLSISALITVALLGLLLGVVSVMQMAQTQEALIRNNFITLDLGLKLRQSLGDQLILMLSTRHDPKALQASIHEYQHLLDEGIEHERKNNLHNGFVQARADYESFLKALNSTHDSTPDLSTDNELRNSFNLLRNGLIAEPDQASSEQVVQLVADGALRQPGILTKARHRRKRATAVLVGIVRQAQQNMASGSVLDFTLLQGPIH